MNVTINPQQIGVTIESPDMGIQIENPVARDVVSPYIKVEETEEGAVITCTDPDGTTTGTVYNGKQGEQGESGKDGRDGRDGRDGADGRDGVNGQDGARGVTFTPSVSAEGVISWTNDGGLENPTAVNIKGSKGDTGASGTTDYNDLKNKPTIPSKTSDLTNDSGYITGMYYAAYGKSTYDQVLAAYQAGKIVYARASSNNNPATGNQLRLAFLAYVNSEETPTEFEFQYYRSVANHSDSTQGDQVFVYKLKKTSGWEVTTRNAYTKIEAGTGLSSSYSNGVLTLSLS